jgi:hypothetical protein
MPAGRVLIRPADVSALSQSAYQQTHRRMPSVHLSMAGSVSGKDQSSTTTPSFNTSVFVSDMDDPTSVRSLHHINMPEPLVSEPVARPQGMNPLLEQDAWLTKIREITVDIHGHKSKDNDVLGALTATFDSHLNDEYFPTKIAEVPPVPGAWVPHYKFQEEYVEHPISVMRLISDAINVYLQAAQKPRSFTFGHSTFYGGRSFEELIYSNWTTKPIVLNLQHHLLQCLQSAHRAISMFMLSSDFIPSRGYPQVASPTFTSNTEFAAQVQEILAANPSPLPSPKSPTMEDDLWQSNLDTTVLQASYAQQSTSQVPRVRNESSESEEAPNSNDLKVMHTNNSQALSTPVGRTPIDHTLIHNWHSGRSEPMITPLLNIPAQKDGEQLVRSEPLVHIQPKKVLICTSRRVKHKLPFGL